jgi:catalase
MNPKKPVRAATQAASKTARAAAQAVSDVLQTPVPGSPGPLTPTVEEPTEPREPAAPAPAQRRPDLRSATGAEAGGDDARAQQGAFLTTATGTRLYDTDHSLARTLRRVRDGRRPLPGRVPRRRRRDSGVRPVLHGPGLSRVG